MTSWAFTEHADAIRRKLEELLRDDYCRAHMNLSSVAGFLGELVVGQALRSAGLDVQHLGKQHGDDLRVPARKLRIDVKASLLKNEIGQAHWGWALLSGSKKKEITFSHVVCVAFAADFKPLAFYVVPRGAIDEFPAGIPPFKNNRRILLMTEAEELNPRANAAQRETVTRCRELKLSGKLLHAQDEAALVRLLV